MTGSPSLFFFFLEEEHNNVSSFNLCFSPEKQSVIARWLRIGSHCLDTPLLTRFDCIVLYLMWSKKKTKTKKSYLDEYLIDKIRSVNLLKFRLNYAREDLSLMREDFTQCTCEWSTFCSERGLFRWPSAYTASALGSSRAAFHQPFIIQPAQRQRPERSTNRKQILKPTQNALSFLLFPLKICQYRLVDELLVKVEEKKKKKEKKIVMKWKRNSSQMLTRIWLGGTFFFYGRSQLAALVTVVYCL